MACALLAILRTTGHDSMEGKAEDIKVGHPEGETQRWQLYLEDILSSFGNAPDDCLVVKVTASSFGGVPGVILSRFASHGRLTAISS